MREPARDTSRIEHIMLAIGKIEEYTDGITFEQLTADCMRMHATIYNIQIIGEASYKLTKEFKEGHPEVPWTLMEKMRHVLVHDYYRILPEALWDVVTSDIPALKQMMEKLQQSL
jgi:uncharacterized protein with HEPN domain